MAGAPKVAVKDVLALMQGMAANKVGCLEMPGLKLTAAFDRPATPSAASGFVAPTQAPQPTNEQAIRAVQAARLEATRIAEEKLKAQQAHTANLRRRAAGGIGSGTARNVEKIYEASIAAPGGAKQPKPA